jgi:cellobiose phosphorylase
VSTGKRSWKLPRDENLGLVRIESAAGMSVSALPNGCIFAIEHKREDGAIMINQILGAPAGGSITRLYVRMSGMQQTSIEAVGPGAQGLCGAGDGNLRWEGETNALSYRVTLSLHPRETAWLWRLDAVNNGGAEVAADAILIQDIGLGERAFLMNNEAYASQYIDHHIARHSRFGPVVMSRQNLSQRGRNPWAAHGCLEGASSFATDGKQLFGPAFRGSDVFKFPFGTNLPGERLQHELACVAIQSFPLTLQPGRRATWRFFGLYEQDHAAASQDSDLARIDAVEWNDRSRANIALAKPLRSLVQNAAAAAAKPIGAERLAQLYPERWHEERVNGELLSFFVPDPPHNRHVVLMDKERLVTRRHGTLLRSGRAVLPDDAALCATCWMHGVFAAQLTIGNTSFHKLFSVSRDPYNIIRTSGLRIMMDAGSGWQLLAVPSAFEMSLSDCRWIYELDGRTIAVRAIASGEDPAMQWQISAGGGPCRFLIFGHLTGGERELESDAVIEADPQTNRFSLRPSADSLWGQRYPGAVYHLVVSTPNDVEAIGGDELLYPDGQPRSGAYAALCTKVLREFSFAVTGSMTDRQAAEKLAAKYERGTEDVSLLAPARRFWGQITRNFSIKGGDERAQALSTLFPWLAHNALIHLTVPHGLEQYTGAAWGTRDVCQGPVELLLALEHDGPVKEILQTVFAQQYEAGGGWPQWFMLEPYSIIQDRTSHGDVIIWPLKALSDYIEATGDTGFLDEPVAWRREDTFERTERKDPVGEHVRRLLETVQSRFIRGTHLIRYGEGDWNDSLQPADPKMRDWMVSSWTVALLFEQLNRYASVLTHAGRSKEASALSELAAKISGDFNRYLIADGTVAGYALFDPGKSSPELLLHPNDTRTGLKYSLLPMTRSIIGGLFTPGQAAHHLRLIREHLLFPDGAHLIDRPVAYHGGPQTTFRRAESSAFFGREIGLMYVHAHLRYAEAMAVLGDADALWDALLLANPVSLMDRLPQAMLRQRNTYFSSSDAAFPDRYAASRDWDRVKAGTAGFEGGWRIYSSGPGIYISLLIRQVLGHQREWGKRVCRPLLPKALEGLKAQWDICA